MFGWVFFIPFHAIFNIAHWAFDFSTRNANMHPNILVGSPAISLESHSGVWGVVFAHLELQNTRSPFSTEGTALAQITKCKAKGGRV